MMTSMLILVLGLIALHVQKGGGAAMHSPLELEIVHGRQVSFCSYENMKLSPNSTFFDLRTCSHCSCDHDGLFCYTGSHITENPDKPSECKVIYVACEPLWVMKSNEMADCPTHLIPEHGMVGK
ncbi:uncharacterized protein LOC127867624 [Dreissena polymorpha]|uniref:Uncharacterized protein n=1 Tax=Dreissena polymorpha TaxID=45954 RepID=A0A9D4LYZ8_DREPO|nr:uncharacterized protein LOC127867624 [Dreissena polymorpha]KAH3867772.1 hypothetical protein DPMN_030908 [Dreissena polymorpha]